MEYWDNLLQNGKSIQNLIRKTWNIEPINQGQVHALTNVTYDSDVPAQAEAGMESLRSFVTPCVWWHCLAKKGHLLHANFQRNFSLPFGFRLNQEPQCKWNLHFY